ncbi:MAG TPA: lytic transglycosylase domain-containing protein [Ignavibacteriales bacterium]|nr:lytic transglycosylase domain-containing protein [Ignavibacteriales bacterium]
MTGLKNFVKNNKFLTGAVLAALVLTNMAFFQLGADIEQHPFPQEYRIITPRVPDSAVFCGERVPLEDFEMRERFERELIVNTYFHSSTIFALKRVSRWFPVIEPILKEEGVPDDFKYLAVIESNLANGVSPAGAVGFWQITEYAGKKYGLEINDQVDERYNVEKSTRAACKYLKEAYEKFNSWTLAAASYNFGVNGIINQMSRQRVNTYYDLLLGEETGRYIFRILAMKEILNHPENFGYNIPAGELYPPLNVKMVEIDSSVSNWAEFAGKQGITYQKLKYYNPWLRDTLLLNKNKKKYQLKMP